MSRLGDVMQDGLVRHISFGERKFLVRGNGAFFNSIAEGPYTEPNIEVIRRYMSQGATLIDIGANIGLISLGLADRAGHIYAIEPGAGTFEFLKANITACSNISAHKLLIGSGGTSKTFLFNSSDPTGSTSVAKGVDFSAHPCLVPETCAAVSLDSFTADIERIDLIKIDTEGAEIEVLRSGAQTIARHLPIALIEFNSHTLMNFGDINPPHALAYIRQMFPHVYRIEKDASLSPVTDGYTFMYENVLMRGCVDDLLCSFSPLI
jgi:FkbM family methyltransferase